MAANRRRKIYVLVSVLLRPLYGCMPTYNPDFDEVTMLMTTVVLPATATTQDETTAPEETTVTQESTTSTSTTTTTTTTTTTEKLCEYSAKKFMGYCYLFRNNREWGDDDCTGYGGGTGHLASIHSQAEMDFINANFIPINRAWIGLRNYGAGFVWSDGTPVDYTGMWATGEPMNDCVFISMATPPYWSTEPCINPKMYHRNLCKWLL